MWLLLDGNINKTTPTNDAALNAAAAALVAEAQAATATPSTLTVTAATPAAGATSTTVTITGKAGAVVSLSASGGTLSRPERHARRERHRDRHPLGGRRGHRDRLGLHGRRRQLHRDRADRPDAAAPGDRHGDAEHPHGLRGRHVHADHAEHADHPGRPRRHPDAAPRDHEEGAGDGEGALAVRYTIVVRNTSKVAARSVVLRDAIRPASRWSRRRGPGR